MKPTKMRNNLIYQATFQTRSKQLGSALSKELHKKYGKRSVRVIEGDTVKILRGEFTGVEGKVSKVSTQKSSVAVEGVKKEKTKGDKFDVYIHTSNLVVTSLNTDDKWRISKLEGK
ncbi:ribosomal protein L24, partial [Candidatus Nitrosopumilus salaria BD31]